MSEWNRIVRTAKAYGNRGLDELEKLMGRDPVADAHRELDDYMAQPVPTTGGQTLRPSESDIPPQTVQQPSEAHKLLGISTSSTKAELKAAYDLKDKRIQKLIRECTKRAKEAEDSESAEVFKMAKAEATALRAKLKAAYLELLQDGDTMVARFRSLQLEESSDQKNEAVPDESGTAKDLTKKRFRSLDLGD